MHDQQNEGNEPQPVREALVETFEGLDHRLEHGGGAGIPTGLNDLDKLIGGLHPSELLVLAARPSMGKTALASNIARNVAIDCKIPTLVVSLEMSRVELAQRMLCSVGRINSAKFRSGFISPEDREKLVKASVGLSKAPLYIDDKPRQNQARIARTACNLRRRQGLGLLIIDNLQLIETDHPQQSREEQLGAITREIKFLTRELRIPVLLISQLNRGFPDMERRFRERGNRPDLSHLRGSGVIEECADVVLLLHREEYYHTREEAENRGIAGVADLIVAKQRNGPVGDVRLGWFPQSMYFENMAENAHDEFQSFERF